MAMNFEGPKAELETAKQIITLSTGAIAFTVTFMEKFRLLGEGSTIELPTALYCAWVTFGFAVAFALWHLMALNGTIVALHRKENRWTLNAGQQQSVEGDEGHQLIPGVGMIIAFVAAVACLVWLGVVLGSRSSGRTNPCDFL